MNYDSWYQSRPEINEDPTAYWPWLAIWNRLRFVQLADGTEIETDTLMDEIFDAIHETSENFLKNPPNLLR